MVVTVAPVRSDALGDTHRDPPAGVPGALVNVSEAARLVGCSRSTIVRRVRDGALTKRPDGTLQVVDLLREFGELAGIETDPTATATPIRDAASDRVMAHRDAASDSVMTQSGASVPLSVVEALQNNMGELIEQLQRQGEAMQQADAAHAADRAAMAARLDAVTSRLDRLLSHDAAPPAPAGRPGFFARLFG